MPRCATWTLAVALAATLAGCASPPSDLPAAAAAAQAPALGFFSPIKVPDGHDPVLRLTAKGTQVFRCEGEGSAYQWRFRQPDAELFDAAGKVVAKHGAGFSFEHRDGSRLLGSVEAHEKAPTAETLPWLLLATRSFGNGGFAGVSYVQRLDTRGGMPPPACSIQEANRLLRVEFSATFFFYRPRG